MRNRLNEIEKKYMAASMEASRLNRELAYDIKDQESLLNKIKDIDKAASVLQGIAQTLQADVKEKIEGVVQLALDYIFPEYTFVLDFVARRDKTEVDMGLIDPDGNRQGIMDSTGGGCVDIIAFALRVAIWALDDKSPRIMFLDEPMHFVSDGGKVSAAEMIRAMSEKLGIQFIIVSHMNEIKDMADVSYQMEKDNKGICHIR